MPEPRARDARHSPSKGRLANTTPSQTWTVSPSATPPSSRAIRRGRESPSSTRAARTNHDPVFRGLDFPLQWQRRDDGVRAWVEEGGFLEGPIGITNTRFGRRGA
ncbi:MAG: hypothetical protein MZV64_59460 [Ignavibacteriales bacterium]|nr:hypothetical protein [Ignavibacteriales bacterium]